MRDEARRNALSAEMAESLLRVLAAVRDNREVRGITLKGSGGVFCSGGDLKGMAKHIVAGDAEKIRQMSAEGGKLFAAVANAPQVTVALVDGPAMAGGLGLVCCADIVAVTPSAKFALTEVKLGIPPAQIAPYVVRRLGLPVAKRLMLTASSFEGEEAHGMGLADHLATDASSLENFEAEVKRRVSGCAPGAVAATKRLALMAADTPPEELNEKAAEAFTECLLSDEGREGTASFVEKRKPSWAEHG
jgi:isohexenylglutaconyl-CoA hydratase